MRDLPTHAPSWSALGLVLLAACPLGCFRTGFSAPPIEAAEDAGDVGACAPLDRDAVLTDNTPPSIQLISPVQGSTVSGQFQLCADASDDVHLVGVRFRIGAVQLGAEDATAPYCHVLDSATLPDGEHELIAVARDAAGNQSSARLSFLTDNGPTFTGRQLHVCDCAAGADPDCVPGDDLADGLQPATAQRSSVAAQLLLDGLGCGESLLLCAGGAFETSASLQVPSLGCQSNPARIGAYHPPWASGDEARPRWTRTSSGHGLSISDATGPLEGLVVEELHLRCSACVRGSSAWGLAVTGPGVVDVKVRRCEVEGFDWGCYLSHSADVSLDYNAFHHNKSAGMAAGGPGLAIRYSSFEHNGCIDAPDDDSCAYDWSLFVGFLYNDARLTVVGNEITRTAVDSQGRCRGVALQVNGGSNGARIDENYIHEPPDGIREGCSGIQAIGNPDNVSEFCASCSISRNRLENVAAGVVVAAHQGSVIASNVISMPAAPSTSTPCIGIALLGRLDDVDLETTANSVTNNSIFIGRDDPGCTAVQLAAEGADHVVANNAIHYDERVDSFSCFRYADPAVLSVASHNVCAAPLAPGSRWVSTNVARLDLSGWQSAGHGEASSQQTPGFTSPDAPAYSFEPCACDQALRDRGLDLACPPTDLSGTSRPVGETCDIGAYER